MTASLKEERRKKKEERRKKKEERGKRKDRRKKKNIYAIQIYIAMNHNFKNLKIWKLSMEITSDVHRICMGFPKNEMYGLVSQMNRASVSIPSNIAEGSNRTNKHFSQYLNISLGSSFELQTQLLIAQMHNYISLEITTELENKIIEFQKMIAGFIAKLN